MINRVLIRIKVVQLLYSYLLTQSDFSIEPAADNPSRDKKYGHDLYLDLLMLILELSGIDVSQGRRQSPLHGLAKVKHIEGNAMARSLGQLDELRALMLRERPSLEALDGIAAQIYEAIPTLPAYKKYARLKERTLADDVELWVSIITNLVAENPAFVAAARRHEGYTVAGFTRAVGSTLSTLKEYGDNRTLQIHARNALDRSLGKARELYFSLLQLIPALTFEQEQRLDANKHKFLPTDADLHPNMRFVESKLARALAENPDFKTYIEESKISWDADPMLLKSLLDAITSSEAYREYMEAPEDPDFAADAEFWRHIFKTVILPSDDLAEALENKSVYWNDDLHVMGEFVLKTLRRFSRSTDEGASVKLLPQYKDEEDSRFGPELFEKAVKGYREMRELIDRFVTGHRWEADRLAFMDIVVMVAALTEILNFPSIPLAVSLNEYIEIAHAYSTPRSGAFVNGVLYAIVNQLREDGRLLKA